MSYRDRDNQPPLPKPYEFVPLADRVATGRPTGHDRYVNGTLQGVLTATIIARSPVHVSSGLLEQRNDRAYPMVKGHVRSNDRPIIPGTSLKGCIRSIVEAITRSSVQITRARELDTVYQPSRSPAILDVAQRIFGALGYQGLVQFGDAPLESGETVIVPSVQLFRPRTEATGVYFDGRRARGRKFYMHGKLAKGNLPLEACPVESRFALTMQFANLKREELGLVLVAMGLGEQRFLPKLGGGKPACLGTIELTDVAVQVWEPALAYSDFDVAMAPIDPVVLTAAATPLIQQTQLARIADILRWPREDRNCPDRNY